MRRVRGVFLRGLGVVSFTAFRSLHSQVLALFGKEGLSPMEARRQRLVPISRDTFESYPSAFLWRADDTTLLRGCQAGEALSLLLMAKVAPSATCAGLGGLYLSYLSMGGSFLSYQWDTLLIESLFHGSVVAAGSRREPTRMDVAFMRWLVFRLYLGSGVAKLESRDPTWRNLTALKYHYETQPLPTPLGWQSHQLPLKAHKLATAVALGIELALPFLAFGPRPVRLLAFGGFTALQLMIGLTGNYAFFNWLSALLGVWLLDDELLTLRPAPAHRPSPSLGGTLRGALELGLMAVSTVPFLRRWTYRIRALQKLEEVHDRLTPARVLNRYGLFSAMTTERPEIVIEGSRDGQAWEPYELRYKPGALGAKPRWVAPHQPRLDWQLWFAALGVPSPWLRTLAQKLLEGTPGILRLFRKNPFEDGPPRYVRAVLYDYRMTGPQERKASGSFWKRERVGLFLPASRLASGT